jgi:hypothetical protein
MRLLCLPLSDAKLTRLILTAKASVFLAKMNLLYPQVRVIPLTFVYYTQFS